MTCFLSLGRWYGFYFHWGNLIRLGMGFFEFAMTTGEQGHTTDFLEGIMGSSGEVARRIHDDPLKTGDKLPVGFVSLKNGKQAELRVELESNTEKFIGEELYDNENQVKSSR